MIRSIRFWICGGLTALAVLAGVRGQAQVVLNEIMADNETLVRNGDGYPSGYIELFNTSANSVNLGGWTLSDSATSPAKFVFPAGTIIQPNNYLLVWCDSNFDQPGLHAGFKLKNNTDDVSLYQGPTNALILKDSITFGLQITDMSISRVTDGTGSWQLTPGTPGYENAPATGFGSPLALKINEWMATNSAGPLKDWLELYNPSTNGAVNLTGLVISDGSGPVGKRPIPALSFITSNGFVRFWANDNRTTTADADELGFKLSSSSGDRIMLFTVGATQLIQSVIFGTQSRDVSEGYLPDGNVEGGMRKFAKSTPGDSNFEAITNVVFNEILFHTDPPLEDAVELYNPTAQPVDISNYWLSNSEFNPKKYRVPANTIIPAFGFVVLYEYQFDPNDAGFTFNSAHGDQVALFSADVSGNLTGFRLVKAFDATANAISLGRYVKNDGGTDLVPMSLITLGSAVNKPYPAFPPEAITVFRTGKGATNAYPLIGPIVISEIMYHPPDLVLQETNRIDNDWDEYIELSNITTTNVPLYNPTEVTNRWKIKNGVEFEFPTGAYVPARGCVLVVNFNPMTNQVQLDSFRATYGLATNVPIYGPYKGELANSAMTIELFKPDPVQQWPHPDAGYVPQIFVEKVKYEDQKPWPTNRTDGEGYSLHRTTLSVYSNEETNWFAGVPTPGSLDVGASISSQPASQSASVGGNVLFEVKGQGTEPLSYQWYFNSEIIPGQNSSNLVLIGLTAQQAGNYHAQVSNPLGKATSAVAVLSMATGLQISQQPLSQNAVVGGQVDFTVVATGGPTGYQWQFATQNLPGQINPTLGLSNVQASNAGEYRVIVYGSSGSITSQPALLTVAGKPNLAAPVIDGASLFKLQMSTVPGFNYSVEASSNLKTWSTVAIYTNSNGQVIYTVPTTNSYQFYRTTVTK